MVIVNKRVCPTCGQSINDREITLFRGMIDALFVVWKWCKEQGVYEFSRKQVKHLFKGENQTARFGDLIYFGGLVYRLEFGIHINSKGYFGINIERCNQFFAGLYKIPTSVWKNPLNGEITLSDYKMLGQIKKLRDFLNENMEYIVKYRENYMADHGQLF